MKRNLFVMNSQVAKIPDVRYIINYFCDRYNLTRNILEADLVINVDSFLNIEEDTDLLKQYALSDKQEKKVLHITRTFVYGSSKNFHDLLDEHSPYKPENEPAARQAATDMYIRALWKSFDLPVVAAVINDNWYNYGVDLANNLVEEVVTSAIGNNRLVLNSEKKHQFTFIGDIVNGVEAIINFSPVGVKYNLVSQMKPLTDIEMSNKILNILNIKNDKILVDNIDDYNYYSNRVISSTLARRTLGWKESLSDQENLEYVVNALKEKWKNLGGTNK